MSEPRGLERITWTHPGGTWGNDGYLWHVCFTASHPICRRLDSGPLSGLIFIQLLVIGALGIPHLVLGLSWRVKDVLMGHSRRQDIKC